MAKSNTLFCWSRSMPRSNPLLWPKPPAIWSYGIAVLSVASALIISRLPAVHLQDAPVSLFLCAVLLSAWFGGVGPGLLATALSALAFNYYFLPPIHSFGPKPDEIPRLVIFTVSALFVGSLSAAERSAIESLRRARDDLRKTVQELQSTNEALQAESLERKHAEEARREAQAELARVSRVTTMGELTASLAHEVNQPIAAAVTNANTCLRWLTRDHPDLEEEDSATGAGGRKRSHSRDDRPLAQRGNAIQHNSPDGASRRSSPDHGRSCAIATGADEPYREQHRCDEGSGRDARVGRQVAENGERRSSGVRQRHRRRASPAAGGSGLQRVFYNEASRHRHGASHQPLHS